MKLFCKKRIVAALSAVLLLFSLCSATVSADDTAGGELPVAEPYATLDDNGASCTIACAFALGEYDPATLRVSVDGGEAEELPSCSVVTQFTASSDDGTQETYLSVIFAQPTEQTEAVSVPSWLFQTEIGGEVAYALAYGHTYVFSMHSLTGSEIGYTLTTEKTASFSPDAPQNFMISCEKTASAEEDTAEAKTDDAADAETYTVTSYFAEPASVRNLLALTDLSVYGYTAMKLYYQTEFLTAGAESVFTPADPFPDAGTLVPLYAVGTETESTTAEITKSLGTVMRITTVDKPVLPEETETEEAGEKEEQSEKTEEDGEDASVIGTYAGRFLLVMTAADGTEMRYASGFTDAKTVVTDTPAVSVPTVLPVPETETYTFTDAENGDAVLCVLLDPQESLNDAAVTLTAMNDPTVSLFVDAEASVNGGDWFSVNALGEKQVSATLADTYYLTVPADMLTDYAYIRVRFAYGMTADGNTYISDWSEPLVYDRQPTETAESMETTLITEAVTEADTGELAYVCPLCGFCPAPYGICLFLWIGAILLILLLVVLVIALLPRKKHCPRCGKKCELKRRTCPECGYRFVGNLPRIDETDETEEDATPDRNPEPKPEKISMLQQESVSQVSEKPQETETVHSPMPEKRPTPDVARQEQAETPMPQVSAEFLVALRAKMTEAKTGGHPHFTPAEVAYIRALHEKRQQREKAAQEAAAAQTNGRRPMPSQVQARPAAVPTAPTPVIEKPKTEEPVKPVKTVKCPLCAVPNPETNERCYICGNRLK